MTTTKNRAPESHDALLERYEALRSHACLAAPRPSRELALLVDGGMATWMQAWSSLTAPSIPRRSALAGEAPTLACPELVTVLAEMAMAAAKEEIPA